MPVFRFGSFLDRTFGPSEQRSLPPPLETMMGPWGVPFVFKPKQSLQAYGDNVWLYGAVTKIAFEIAKTNFKLRLIKTDDEFEPVEKHQALETMRRPQPNGQKTLLTGFNLKFLTAMHLLLGGEGYWALDGRLKSKFGGSPTRIDIPRPDMMYPQTDKNTGDLVSYAYRTPGKEVNLALEDVVQFKMPDPLNPYRGHSPTQSIRYALDTQYEADILNLKRIQNNAVPSGILKPETTITAEKADQWRKVWQQLYGGSENSGKVAVLPGKADFQQLQLTPLELQFLQGKEANRDEILAAYGVGLEMLGKTESQTRANADTSVFVFMKFGVSPFLYQFADTLTNDYLPAFAGVENMEFHFDDPVPENMEEKRANADSLYNAGALTPNERRKMFGLEPLNTPGMDDTYLDFNKIAVGSGSAPPLVP